MIRAADPRELGGGAEGGGDSGGGGGAAPEAKMGDEAVVVSATGVVSLLNYGYTLVLLWLLPAREFAEVGSISALLLICGTVSGAALPWVLAQEVLRSRDDEVRRRIAVTFCLFATVLQGAAAGLATCLIALHYSNGPALAAAFCSVVLIFVAATAAGYFQGLQRFRLIASLRVAEVVVKIGAGVGLVTLGAGAGGAIAGFALGAAVVAGAGLAAMAPNVRWNREALAGRNLWSSTQGLMAIQGGVAVLASMDVVIASLVLGAQPALATYQAANIFGRVPVFVGAALSIVVFPRMIAGRRHPRVLIRDSLALYVRLCLPIALITATLPASVVGMLFPARYGNVGEVLPWTALAGLVMGVVNLTTTYFQAAGLFRRTTSLLAFGVALSAALDVFGLELLGVVGLAVAVALGAAVVSGALLREIHRTWPGALSGLWRPGLRVLGWCLPLLLLRPHLVIWSLWAAGCAVAFCWRGLLGVSSAGGPTGSTRPRVLHLGYEDPARPGTGGGSVRTHEINRRLARSYDITVVCARYRGCRQRVEDGVRYVHVGIASGYFAEKLAYFAFLPWALLKYPSELVIEDFGAPFSTVAIPWMTARPVLGVVQWLFAKEKSEQYHVPFSFVERMGVRSHRRMIAVSDDLGAVLAERNPRAQVTVVANGLDAGAFESYDRPRSGIAYLGRLEIAQKGLDLLLEAFARVADGIDQDLLLGGDGPDRDALVELAGRLGIAERVRFVGRVAARERFEWLAGADLVAMPSRYETFGMVAAESLAVATPVVAFDIPCLRALVDEEVGRRVPAGDVDAFAGALLALARDADLRRRLGDAGPPRVAGLNWDDLAAEQGRVYGQLLRGGEETAPCVEPPRSIVGRFAEQCHADPDQVAVVDGHTEWTYAGLQRAAHAIYESLQSRGIGLGDRVGVCLPRSKEAIAAMLGIWGAGATYVPLDPEYPAARLREMCERASVRLIVGDPDRTPRLARSVSLLDPVPIVGGADAPVREPRALPEPTPDLPAYILFTSGSSGRPKGVEVAHRSLSSVLEWLHSALGPDELAVTATSISFSFDPFVLEVLGPLTAGGTVRVIRNALAVADLETGITMLANTPSVLAELWRAGRLPPSLKVVIAGGEILAPSLATGLLVDASVPRLLNTYGPTEATVLATAHEVELPVGDPVPIGRPLPGADVVLLDDRGRPIAHGERGEICISGPQVALGYLDDPAATGERFVERRGADGAPVRIYRTGDLGRRRADGALEFCGRKDRQLKLRGYRVEPGEIEAALVRHPDVGQALVTPVGQGPDAALVGYVTSTTPNVTSLDLQRWLEHSLPKFMVPVHVVVMERFPVTPNGKIAVGRLPAWPPRPSRNGARPDRIEGRPGGDEAVDAVARLAGRILPDVGPVAAEDDFLEDLGGSSLALFQLLTAIEDEFSCRIEIGRILEDTTIAGLARLVRPAAEVPPLLSVHGDGDRQPIFLIHAYLGTALRYRRLGRYLSPDRPLVGIQVQEFDSPTSATRTTVDQMAEEAVTQVRAFRSKGPYLLGGHSAGGLVAYEAARRLVDRGEEVPLVVLLDSPVPRSPLHYLWGEAVVNWPDVRHADARQRLEQVRSMLESRFSRFRRTPGSDRVGAAVVSSYRSSNLAVKRYRPGPYAGEVVVMSTRQGVITALGKQDLGWRPHVTGHLTTIEIPGLHNSVFDEPQLGIVGRHLALLVDQVDGTPGNVVDDTRAPPTDQADLIDTGRRRSSATARSTVPSDRSSIAR
jgi:amino acid adenylation domain-containing protein